jgi:hypothetical protein
MSATTNTAQRLKAMTDRSEFERLAIEVLRHADSSYATAIALGTNALGETVRSVVDGFALVSGSNPPHYVAIESTTTEPDELKRKWLHDHRKVAPKAGKEKRGKTTGPADDGDLVKAAAQAVSLQEAATNARFTVVLATNQGIDFELQKQVYVEAVARGVEVDIWERSRFTAFLDTDPTGHYLRLKYFGLSAERLSRELLRELGEKTLSHAEARIRGGAELLPWIEREHEENLRDQLADASFAMNLLIADSGMGKTVTACRLMRRWLDDGGLALWISEQAMIGSLSLEAAIDRVIRELMPTIVETSARTLGSILGSKRLLLVVDDVNRTAQPSMLLRQLVQSTAAVKRGGLPVCVLCPAWPHVVQGADLREHDDVRQLVIGCYTADEASLALRMSGPDAARLADSLGFDPLAIALYREMQAMVPGEHIDPSRVVEMFVVRRLQALQGLSVCGCRYPEYREAVVALSIACLENYTAAPTVAQVMSWFGPALPDSLREVLTASAVIGYAADDSVLVYRHDRVRDHLLALGMQRIVEQPSRRAPFIDPYYAEVAGEALARLDEPSELVAMAAGEAPLVLACALRHVTPRSAAETAIVDALRAWLRKQLAEANSITFELDAPSATSVVLVGSFQGWIPSSGHLLVRHSGDSRWRGTASLLPGIHQYKFIVDGATWVHDTDNPDSVDDGYGGRNSRHRVGHRPPHPATLAVCDELSRSDSPAVLAVTADLPITRRYALPLALARFRHGDLRGGLTYFVSHRGDLELDNDERERAVTLLRPTRRAVMVEELKVLVPRLTEPGRLAAVRLAGQLGGPQSVEVVRTCWTASTDRDALLVSALQALLSGDNAQTDITLLDELLAAFSKLSAEISDGGSARGRATTAIANARCRPSLATMQLLVERGDAESPIKYLVWDVFDGNDHPLALEALARWAGAQEDAESEGGPEMMGSQMLLDSWRRAKRPIADAGAARLQTLWQSSAESPGTRHSAFRLWTQSAIGSALGALPILRAVDVDSDNFERALWHRAQLGDTTSAPLVAERFRRSAHWAHVVHRVWNAELAEVASDHLASFADDLLTERPNPDSNDHSALTELLPRIPSANACQLLRRPSRPQRHRRVSPPPPSSRWLRTRAIRQRRHCPPARGDLRRHARPRPPRRCRPPRDRQEEAQARRARRRRSRHRGRHPRARPLTRAFPCAVVEHEREIHRRDVQLRPSPMPIDAAIASLAADAHRSHASTIASR